MDSFLVNRCYDLDGAIYKLHWLVHRMLRVPFQCTQNYAYHEQAMSVEISSISFFAKAFTSLLTQTHNWHPMDPGQPSSKDRLRCFACVIRRLGLRCSRQARAISSPAFCSSPHSRPTRLYILPPEGEFPLTEENENEKRMRMKSEKARERECEREYRLHKICKADVTKSSLSNFGI